MIGPDLHRPDGERGVALLIVLWTIAFLALVLSVFAAGMRADLRIARNRLAAVEAQAAADAGVALALIQVADAASRAANDPAAAAWIAAGTPRDFVWQGAHLTVWIEDEGAKIDLNVAQQEILVGLLLALGAEPAQAADLGAAIVTWRTQRAEALGLTRHAARRVSEQPVGPFLAVEELRLVPGMTAQSYALLEPYVTVWTARPRPDPRTASRVALLSLPGIDPARVDAWLALRAAQGQATPIPPDLLPGMVLGNLARPIVTVRSEAETGAGAKIARTAVAAVTGTPDNPVRILTWQAGRPADSTLAPAP